MILRTMTLATLIAVTSFTAPATAQQMPSVQRIERMLDEEPELKIRPEKKVTVREFKRRPEFRRAAPSIDIQAINFAYNSAVIPPSQYQKVEIIADALDRLLERRSDAVVLIEGHSDAVGSRAYNYELSDARARSLKRMLARDFGIPPYAMETVGYGEDYLLVPTQHEEWRNRRVTLRRIDDFLR